MAAFSDVAAVLAVHRPGERLPPPGALRLRVEDEDWVSAVRGLVTDARFVIVDLSDVTAAVGLELELCFSLRSPRDILILLPWTPGPRRASRLARASEELEAVTGRPLPPESKSALFVWFDRDGEPVLLGRRWPKLRTLLRSLTSSNWPPAAFHVREALEPVREHLAELRS